MKSLLGIVLLIVCLGAIASSAQAAKSKQIEKERLVLMPLRVGDDEQSLKGAMETALVQGLQQKYVVFSGEQVAQKAREIFMKESRNAAKKDCDETRCMQGIAEAFQAELIATANVTKRSGGYFLALSIRNIFDNKVEYSNSVPCENCSEFQVVDKLKELSGPAPVASAASDTPSPIALPAVPTAPKLSAAANDADSQTWAEIVKGNTPEDYQLYLDSYPQGRYAKQAAEQKQKLGAYVRAKAEAEQQQQEDQAWNAAQQADTTSGYQKLLEQYPKGRYVVLAKIKLKRAQEADLEKLPQEIEANMVRIPGKDYEMGKYEITQKEWKAVMGSNPSSFSSCGDTCPVENVSWDDVQIFLQKLNARTSRQYRLPTEAEWEYACYGGSKTEYCGSDNIDSVAWYDKNSNNTTHPAGQNQANGYGLYDMSGNVWEWMQDWYDSSQNGRSLRGGSWNYGPQSVRASVRGFNVPALRVNRLGFRLARTLP